MRTSKLTERTIQVSKANPPTRAKEPPSSYPHDLYQSKKKKPVGCKESRCAGIGIKRVGLHMLVSLA